MSFFSGLYRDTDNGRIAGVCAGLADHLGQSRRRVRLVAVLLAVFFPPQTLLAYLVAALLLPRRPADSRGGALGGEAPARPRFDHRPGMACAELAARFQALDQRVIAAERYVTSAEFKLNRAFRDLEGRSS